MKKITLILLVIILIVVSGCVSQNFENEIYNIEGPTYALPIPEFDGNISLETALESRRSRRNFQDKAISLEQLSQILWAAYGITSPNSNSESRGGLRTTPSAGALYPLEIYVIVGNIENLAPGVYKYISETHEIMRVIDGDIRSELSEAVVNSNMVLEAPITIFYSAIFDRTTDTYGERGRNYVYIELGHSAQNIYLQVETLGLGTVAVGAFTDDEVKRILKLPANETPLYIMPIGYYN